MAEALTPLCTPPFAHQRTVINSFSGAADDNPSYVLSLSGDATGRLAAVAGSEFDLKLYDRATLQPLGALGTPAHAGRINEICFGGAAAPGLLYSASSDHSVRVWDCASPSAAGPVATLHDRREEVFCLSASAGHLLAAGTQSAVLIWDTRRAGKPLCRWEVHTDEVTQVCFQPGSEHVLLSGSVDGLICALDCRHTSEDEAVTNIYNNEVPVSGLGFFGTAPAAHAYALSSVETLSVWSLQEGVRLQHFDQIRRDLDAEEDHAAAAAAPAAAPPPAPSAADGIDFLVGCQWDAAAQKLYLVAGEHGGTAHLLRVEADALTVEASLRSSSKSRVPPWEGFGRGHSSLAWPPGTDSPGSWLRHPLRRSASAAPTPMTAHGAAFGVCARRQFCCFLHSGRARMVATARACAPSSGGARRSSPAGKTAGSAFGASRALDWPRRRCRARSSRRRTR